MAKLRILACQIDVPSMTSEKERDAHLARLSGVVRAALSKSHCDLVVLPELSAIDYSRAAFAHLTDLAETETGASFQTWFALARDFDVTVVFGFARKHKSGVSISMGVVGPSGLVGCYDKLHLSQFGASMEKEYFQAGESILTFNIKSFTVAPIICYDVRIPELSRALVLDHGVDLILHCGAYYRDVSFATWHAFATTRAMENQIFLLSLNRAGMHWGNSIMCWPWMDDLRPPAGFDEHAEECRFFELNRDELDHARDTYPFLSDRRARYGITEIET